MFYSWTDEKIINPKGHEIKQKLRYEYQNITTPQVLRTTDVSESNGSSLHLFLTAIGASFRIFSIVWSFRLILGKFNSFNANKYAFIHEKKFKIAHLTKGIVNYELRNVTSTHDPYLSTSIIH